MLNFSRFDSEYIALSSWEAPARLWRGFPFVQGRRVFIKPNLVTPPTIKDTASCTRVEVIELVVQKLLQEGASHIIIGECGFRHQWDYTMELSGYDRLNEYENTEVIPLEEGDNRNEFTLVRLDSYLSLFGARLSNFMLNSDVVINIPKMKVHAMAKVTGAIKNMMGTMTQKGNMHPRCNIKVLHKRLRDLYYLHKDRVQWTLMDGIEGSEFSEQYGVPVNSNLLISGTDMWEVDCASATAMGVDPATVPYLDHIRKSLKVDWPRAAPQKFVKEYELPMAWRGD